MTDHDHVNGNITMRIRDLGSTVEFWVLTDQYTWNHQQNWSYKADGVYHGQYEADMAINAWTKFGSTVVNSSGTVYFTVYDEGLGFPTYTYGVTVSRATAPDPPHAPILTVRSSTSIELDWGGDGDNNGAAIDAREFWGSSTTSPVTKKDYAANLLWTGLKAGTTYYFWAKEHNSEGWSGYSSRASITTWDVPPAPDAVSVTNITNVDADVSFNGNGNGGTGVDVWQVGYGTSSSSPTTIVSAPGGSGSISSLKPGTTYYIWARGHNAVGYGPWGPRSQFTTKDIPDAPSSPVLSEIEQTSVRAKFTDNSNNGASITARQLGWSTSSSGPTTTVSSDTDQVLTGLPPGKQLYFFARTYNTYGWSAWSAAKGARTVAGAWVYDVASKTWKRAIPWVNVNGVWKLGKPWAKIAGVWKETTS